MGDIKDLIYKHGPSNEQYQRERATRMEGEIESLRAEINSTADSEEAWEIEADKWQVRAEAAEKALRKLADAADNVLMDVWGSNDGLRTEVVAAFNLLDDTRKARAAGGETE
jgi:hypothetical protein